MKRFLLRFITYRQAEAIKGWLAACLYCSGLAHLIALYRGKGAKILVYHSINRKHVFSDNMVDPEVFEAHVRHLTRHMEVVPVARIVQCLTERVRVPDRWVAITFDDGYVDNVEHALPVLHRYGAPASFFCTTEVLQGRRRFFYDDIQSAIDGVEKHEIELEIGGKKLRFDLSTKKHRQEAALRIVLGIRQERDEVRQDYVTRVEGLCGKGDAKPIYMTEEALKELCTAGMEVGSHTQSHANLSTLSPGELDREIRGSKAILEEIVGAAIAGLAYPFGKTVNYNDEVIKLTKEAGYSYALTTNFGQVTSDCDLFQLPRIGVGNYGLLRLKVRLLGINL